MQNPGTSPANDCLWEMFLLNFDEWGDHLTEVVVLTAVMIVGVILSVRFFRWK